MSRTFSWGTLVSSLALILLAMPGSGFGQQQPTAVAAPPQAVPPQTAPPETGQPVQPGTDPAPPQTGQPATGAGWITNIAPTDQPAAPDAQASVAPPGSEQAEVIQRISDYFNTVEHLEGRFTQINPDSQMTRGKFYLRRPGLLRFDYASPSRLRIVADGRYLSIEDHDLKTVDQYPLEATPFQLLLGEEVDLLRDATIIDFSRSQEIASVTLEDKKDGSRGRLQLFFTLPEIVIKEWVITDPQGLDTRIQLEELVSGKEIKKEFFKSSALDFQGASEN